MRISNMGGRILNTWLYPIADGYVMIDVGYAHSYQAFLKRMAKQGIAPEKDLFWPMRTMIMRDFFGS